MRNPFGSCAALITGALLLALPLFVSCSDSSKITSGLPSYPQRETTSSFSSVPSSTAAAVSAAASAVSSSSALATKIPATSSVPITSSAPPTTPCPVTFPPCSENHSQTVFLNQEERERLDELLGSYSGSVSLYYLSPLNNEWYAYGSDVPYYAASLVKAPYAYYLLQLADRGECDLEQMLELKEQWKQSGTGVLKNEPAGNLYSVRELIEYMLTVSDNTAFKILREEYSLWNYNKFCRKELQIQSVTYEDVTATDMAKAMAAIYTYIETGSENALLLRDGMARAVFPLIKAPKADLLIHKHGWADPAFHDMAIVYQEHPYVLILMSDHCDGTKEDVKMFSDLSRTVKTMHDTWELLPPASPPSSSCVLPSSAPNASFGTP